MDLETHEQPEPRKRTRTIRPMHVVIIMLCVLFFPFAIFRIAALHRVKQKLDAIRSEGYPVTLEDLDDWYPKPPAGMNAADAYADAFRTYFPTEEHWNSNSTVLEREDNLPVVGEGNLPTLSEPISTDMLDDIAWYIGKNAEAIGFLHEAAIMTECRYPVDMMAGSGMLLPHLSRIRQGARLLYLEAILAAEKGDSERAVQAVTSSFATAHSLKEEPILISHLVRIACNSLSCSTLERVLSRISLSDEQLARLASSLKSEEDMEAMTRAMVAQRCMGIGHFRTPGVLATMRGGPSPLRNGVDFLYRASGARDLDLSAYLGIMDTYVEQSKLPLSEMATMDAQAMHRRINDLPRYYILSRMLTPALGAACRKAARNIAQLRCARLAVAVERYRLAHGTLPENLDTLVPRFIDCIPLDPFDGKPLRYRQLEKGYVVYSVGMNQADDGGTAAKDETPSEYWGQPLDLLFTVER